MPSCELWTWTDFSCCYGDRDRKKSTDSIKFNGSGYKSDGVSEEDRDLNQKRENKAPVRDSKDFPEGGIVGAAGKCSNSSQRSQLNPTVWKLYYSLQYFIQKDAKERIK